MSTKQRLVVDVPSFADGPECTAMYAAIRDIPWDGHSITIYPEVWRSQPEAEKVQRIIDGVVRTISACYDVAVEEECSLLVRMGAGAQHTPHADAELADGSPNHTPQRSHVGLLYFMHPVEGGVLNVWDVEDPKQVARYEAFEGRLVAFPATRHYFHEVTPIVTGQRANLAVWTKRV